MTRRSTDHLQGIAESFGLQGWMAGTSQTQRIRSIQQSRNEEPCFATEKNYYCGEGCEWREDCCAMLAIWLS